MNYGNRSKYFAHNTLGILAGLLVGSLAGAITMLLLAPKSGKDTRMQMKVKSIELRDRTTEMMEDSMAQVRLNASQMAAHGREKMKELKIPMNFPGVKSGGKSQIREKA